jgi:hypothetical protein
MDLWDDADRPDTHDAHARQKAELRQRELDRYAGGIWATRLRHAALAVLIRARGEPVAVADIWAEIRRNHVVQRTIRAKDVADGLRHECRRGRARRVERGMYVVGTIAPRTRRRIMAHERQLRADDGDARARQYFAEVRSVDDRAAAATVDAVGAGVEAG